MKNVLEKLKPREQQIICERYGLSDGVEKTLEEIGNMYGVTKECIRQMEKRAIKKIRQASLTRDLLSCYMI